MSWTTSAPYQLLEPIPWPILAVLFLAFTLGVLIENILIESIINHDKEHPQP